MNKCATIISSHPFWRQPLGSGTLIRSRFEMLNSIFDNVYVIFITDTHTTCPLPGLTIKTNGSVTTQQIELIDKYLKNKSVIYAHFSYISNSEIAPQLSCLSGVEIHDVLHLRAKSFQHFNRIPPVIIDKDEEINHLRNFDFVFSINTDETKYLNDQGVGCMFLPPTIKYEKLPLKNTELQLGLIGSGALPNIDGLEQIIDKASFTMKLNISGALCTSKPAKKICCEKNILHGLVKDVKTHYSNCAISLAPLRFGAGLKIKVLESLSFSRPCIATQHALDGFPEGIDQVSIIENDFSKWNDELITRAQTIKSKVIQHYCEENFSLSKASSVIKNILK